MRLDLREQGVDRGQGLVVRKNGTIDKRPTIHSSILAMNERQEDRMRIRPV